MVVFYKIKEGMLYRTTNINHQKKRRIEKLPVFYAIATQPFLQFVFLINVPVYRNQLHCPACKKLILVSESAQNWNELLS
ncbi:MAG: hypothetical protein HC785_16415 [Calothrix sp. CSU_2_0]|nr:hypothetical protein [Calothrix sp. CSU_2_0]